MVQSPFRYKKPKTIDRPFSDGPNPKQRTTIWIGGETLIGEGTSSSSSSFIATTFRSMFNPISSGRDLVVKSDDENDDNDVEATGEEDQEEANIESTTTSSIDDDDDENDTRGPWSLSTGEGARINNQSRRSSTSKRTYKPTNVNNGNGRRRQSRQRIRSMMNSLSPRRENKDDDSNLFCSPYHNGMSTRISIKYHRPTLKDHDPFQLAAVPSLVNNHLLRHQ